MFRMHQSLYVWLWLTVIIIELCTCAKNVQNGWKTWKQKNNVPLKFRRFPVWITCMRDGRLFLRKWKSKAWIEKAVWCWKKKSTFHGCNRKGPCSERMSSRFFCFHWCYAPVVGQLEGWREVPLLLSVTHSWLKFGISTGFQCFQSHLFLFSPFMLGLVCCPFFNSGSCQLKKNNK